MSTNFSHNPRKNEEISEVKCNSSKPIHVSEHHHSVANKTVESTREYFASTSNHTKNILCCIDGSIGIYLATKSISKLQKILLAKLVVISAHL